MELKSSEELELPLRNVNKITRKQKIGMKKTRQRINSGSSITKFQFLREQRRWG